MKKLIIMAALLAATAVSAATYQVYDFTMNVQTTKAQGKTTTSCGDDYIYRTSGSQKIQGIIAGCGCGAIAADGVCNNAIVLLWNASTRTQITNAEFTTWIVQRIGKTGEKAEHIAEITTDEFKVMLGGIGSYSSNNKNAELSYVSTISGKFGGFALAPYLTTPGIQNCCAPAILASTDQTTAVATCEDGTCTASTQGDITPFFGTYTLKYNKSKSQKAAKNGITNKSLGVPNYVDIEKGFFD